jgi:hypothetical protein
MAGNGDQEDIQETHYWSCSKGCGMGGSAASASEAQMAKQIHEMACDGT